MAKATGNAKAARAHRAQRQPRYPTSGRFAGARTAPAPAVRSAAARPAPEAVRAVQRLTAARLAPAPARAPLARAPLARHAAT